MPSVRNRIIAYLLALLAPLTWLSPAHATPVTLRVQAPIDYNNPGATRLDAVEGYGYYPAFSRDFKVPYDALQTMIDNQLDALVPNTISGVEVCTDPCPDVTWNVKIAPTFKFTKKNQPVVTSIGPSGQSKVKIELTSEARLDIHADVHAETWFDHTDVPVDVYLVVGVKAATEVSLWPEIKTNKPGSNEPGISVEFSLVDKNIDLQLNGQAVALGAKWGTIIGLSPVGLLVGGPILGPILAWIGDEAADMAEEAISDVFYTKVEALFNEQTAQLEDMVNDAIDPYITQANAIRDKALGTPLPGIGQSLNQLQPLMGMSIALHTVTPSGGLSASAITRFTAAAGAGQIQGKLRIPTKTCEYAKVNGGPLKGATIPLGLVDTNLDLKPKVGQSCASAMAGGFTRKAFLGGNPQRYLGASAQKLAEWNASTGALAWSGNMTATDKWYECSFAINNLPNAAIVELNSDSWLENHHVTFEDRYLEANPGVKVLLDNFLKPVAGTSLVLGGEGKCSAGGGGRGIEKSKLDALKDALDPEKCPQCGIVGKVGIDEVINVAHGDALVGIPAGKAVLDTVTKMHATPNAVTRSPALNKVVGGAVQQKAVSAPAQR